MVPVSIFQRFLRARDLKPDTMKNPAHSKDVDARLRSPVVVVLRNDEGRDWVSGRIAFNDYLAHAVRDAEVEAREDVAQMLERQS